MASLSDIQHKLELLMFNSLIAENHIIEDEGVDNVPVKGHNNMRYTFSDTPDYDERNELDIQKLQFLNSVMDIFEDIHQFIYYNDPNNKPMYFLPKNIMEKQYNINDTQNIILQQQHLIENEAPPDGYEDENIIEAMEEMEI